MAIRKTGAVTGQVTEASMGEVPDDQPGLSVHAARDWAREWQEGDELALGQENEAADQG